MKNAIGSVGIMTLGLVALVGCGTVQTASETETAAPPTAARTTTAVAAVVDPFIRTYAKAELLGDFDYLAGLVERTHPKLYADRAVLAERIAMNRERVKEGMTELEFLRLLSPIVSALNCGHSSISLSAAYQNELATRGRYFPLPLRFIAGRAYVARNGLAETIPLGSEILAVNGLPTAEIIRILFGNLPADGRNETYKYLLLNGWFRYRYQNFIDSGGYYEISYRSGVSGEVLAAKLPGAGNEEFAARNGPTWVESEIPFAGELYVLMNGGSFSSTGHLLALLRNQGVGTFIGEESGASFACTDSSRNFTLPATRIQFRSSTQVWAVAAQGLVPGRGIMPDHAVTQDIGQFLAGEDVLPKAPITS